MTISRSKSISIGACGHLAILLLPPTPADTPEDYRYHQDHVSCNISSVSVLNRLLFSPACSSSCHEASCIRIPIRDRSPLALR
ncbi:hypothetical protein RRG08_001984 [Elysia crispata]|uniref:Secreted protein n=1 Tax=Elysia crispata TaxID=231223 RepID=A0AAE1BCG6_9GAST|nr:hypothetical protein RRG08_001984 [Elysia crispata]